MTVATQRSEEMDEIRRRITILRKTVLDRAVPIATMSETVELNRLEHRLARLEEQQED